MEITGKLFGRPGSYVNHPAMRAYVERVHRTGRRWDMMPSTPARVNSFPGIAVIGLLVGSTTCTGTQANGDQPRASERAHREEAM